MKYPQKHLPKTSTKKSTNNLQNNPQKNQTNTDHINIDSSGFTLKLD